MWKTVLKKRKGTKKYKQKLYQCGSLDELRELLITIFLQKRHDNLSND